MGLFFSRFKLQSLLGKGGMAEVFRAMVIEGKERGTSIALKRLLPDLSTKANFLELFLAEANLMRQINHPGVVRLLESGEWNGSYYIAMEYVEGPDLLRLLDRCLAQKIQLSPELCCYMIYTIAKTLDDLHKLHNQEGKALNIIHCDINPSNLFIAHDGQIKLGDFGIAQSTVTQHNFWEKGIAGKSGYIPAESFEGQPPTPATDVFALGALLYKMLTQQTPFSTLSPEEKPAQIAARLRRLRVPPPSRQRPEIPKRVDQLVMRAIAPAQPTLSLRSLLPWGGSASKIRYQHVGELCAAIEKIYPINQAFFEKNSMDLSILIHALFGAPGSFLRDERFEICMPAVMEIENVAHHTSTKNISRTGAFIEVQAPPPIGKRVRLTFKPPEGEFTIDADVVWNCHEATPGRTVGCGIRFVSSEKGSRIRFLNFIDMLFIHRSRDLEPLFQAEEISVTNLFSKLQDQEPQGPANR